MCQCSFAGSLNHWPVGHGIGKRNTEFDDVSTRFDQGMQGGYGEFRGGVACGYEGDQRFAAGPL